MIITGALSVILTIFTTLLTPIFNAIPAMPSGVTDALGTLSIHMANGFGLLIYFLGADTIRFMGVLFSLVFDIEIFIKAWSLIHFVITKIPFLNIDLE